MDFLSAIAEIQIAGNRLWRVLALFGIILAAFIIGRIARFFLQKSAASFDRRGQQIAATTLTATAHGVVFFLAAAGISLGLTFLGLKAKVAGVANAAGAILLAVGVGYLIYWLVGPSEGEDDGGNGDFDPSEYDQDQVDDALAALDE